MNCRGFSKSLKDFIAGELFEEADDKMVKHMSKCEKCKKLYSDEITVYKSINSMASIQNATFNSSREEILRMIDKTRYSKKVINKINFFMKKNSLRYVVGSVAVIAIMFFGFYSANHFKDLNIANILPRWAHSDNISPANSGDGKSSNIFLKQDYNNAENAAKKYLEAYYTIDKNDMELYRVIMGGSKDFNELDAATAKSEKEFKDLLIDRAYQSLVANRMSYGRMIEASKKKYYVTVNNIILEKYTEDKKQQMIAYTYYIELTQTSISGTETKIIRDRNNIHAYKVGNVWKVD